MDELNKLVKQAEGYRTVPYKKHRLRAKRRLKQCWYFKGLDPKEKVYYIFLALKMHPTDYISLTVVNYGTVERWRVDKMIPIKAEIGDDMDVSAKGNWGSFHFEGSGNLGCYNKIILTT